MREKSCFPCHKSLQQIPAVGENALLHSSHRHKASLVGIKLGYSLASCASLQDPSLLSCSLPVYEENPKCLLLQCQMLWKRLRKLEEIYLAKIFIQTFFFRVFKQKKQIIIIKLILPNLLFQYQFSATCGPKYLLLAVREKKNTILLFPLVNNSDLAQASFDTFITIGY